MCKQEVYKSVLKLMVYSSYDGVSFDHIIISEKD